MNFQELMQKMAELDQPIHESDKGDMDHDGKDEPDSKEYMDNKDAAIKKATGKEEEQVDEDVVDECGMMGGMPSPMDAPKQQDSVTMNVSMNGSGAGGIRDLLNVLKDIQDGPSDSMPGDDMDMGPEEPDDMLMKKKLDAMGGELSDAFGNSVQGDEGEMMGGVDMMTHDGDDLHKTKSAYPKASGGDNAMRLKDGATYKLPKGDIQVKLESLYQEILSRDLTEGSGPKEKQHSKYVDRNSADSKSKVKAAKDQMAKDKAAEPGKKLLKKISGK